MKGRKTVPSDDSRLLLKGAFILTIAATITKILSAVYRVPFQNIVGDIGFYIYQQVYPIYGIAIALATYGFPVIISKMVADAEAKEELDSHHIVQASFIVLGILGLFFFSIVFFGSTLISTWMGDPNLAPLIKVVAFSFLLMPFISTIRGYFQGKGEMLPTAVSQVQEQFIRVTLILLISFILVKQGASLYEVGSNAILSSVIGSLTALLVLFIFYLRNKRKKITSLKFKGVYKVVAKKLLIQGLAVCISGALLVLFQFVDALNIFTLLIKSGVEIERAMELKGVFDRGQPLIQLGTVVATSFSLTLVPVLTSNRRKDSQYAIAEKVNISIKFSIIVGLGATVGMICIMEPTNTMLFSNNEGSDVLKVFAISVLFSSMILTMIGILQGFGYLLAPAKYIIIGVFCKFIGNYVLVQKLGTMGASISTILALMVILGLCIYKFKCIGIKLLSGLFYMKIFICAFLMAIILRAWTSFFELFHLTTRAWSIVDALGGVCVGGALYLFMIGTFNLLNERELNNIPFGKFLLRMRFK
ncbi:putative polysaccharide biosynthesis protein [Heyndrickxia sp. NPDC080065]|uniref:putative polysaccharide biosynthesis protein n=1 Tax=Heyndrickxia sp. NPDC080065 TaxID=3390568 RepID=UPI003D063C56